MTQEELQKRLSEQLDKLSPESIAQLKATVKSVLPWKPIEQQIPALLSPADELFFGGRAGSGKSWLLIGMSLTAHRNTLILRRNAVDLIDLVKNFKTILPDTWHWKGIGNGGIATRKNQKDGLTDTIELAGCETEDEMQKFKGRAHDLKCYDELSDFQENVYLFINGWNRTSIPQQRCRIVAASNPPVTTAGEWIIRRWRAWLDPSAGKMAKYGELKWYTTIDNKEEEFPNGDPITHGGYTYRPRSRTFIPGEMLQVMQEGGYTDVVAAMPEPYRTAYMTGDFSAARKDEEFQVIPSAWVRMAQERWVERWKNPGEMIRAGYDVAASKNAGGDRACLAKLYANLVIGPLKTVPGTSTPDGRSACSLMINNGINDQVPVNVDAIGIGAAAHEVSGMMGLNVFPLVVSNATTWRDEKIKKFKFPNIRSAMWWNLRCLLDPERSETRLALPPDPAILADLTAPLFEVTAGGIRVETKIDIRDRIGRSTDVGDAICMANWKGNRGIIVFG